MSLDTIIMMEIWCKYAPCWKKTVAPTNFLTMALMELIRIDIYICRGKFYSPVNKWVFMKWLGSWWSSVLKLGQDSTWLRTSELSLLPFLPSFFTCQTFSGSIVNMQGDPHGTRCDCCHVSCWNCWSLTDKKVLIHYWHFSKKIK